MSELRQETTLPSTLRGALASFTRQRIRLLCDKGCGLQNITAVTEVDQQPTLAQYDLVLQCGHPRELQVAVKRTVSQIAKLTEEEAVAEFDADEQEASEIHAEMAEPADSPTLEGEVTQELAA